MRAYMKTQKTRDIKCPFFTDLLLMFACPEYNLIENIMTAKICQNKGQIEHQKEKSIMSW